MSDLQRINRELDTARERNDHHAQVRLITTALALPDAQPDRAGYLDELAYVYEKLGRFDEAIDAMRQALAAGWSGELDDHPSAQALIADLLLQTGRDQEADEAWAQAEREDPRNPWVHSAASDAYTRVGLHRKALPWQTKGLELALAAGDDEAEIAWYLTGERAQTMDVLGLPPDELQLRAEELIEREEQQDREAEQEFLRRWNERRPLSPQQTHIGAAWFPADQYPRALQAWPIFAEDYAHGPYEAYCARLELMLRDLKAKGVKRLSLTPIQIDEYLAWCTEHDRDPQQSDTRASYSTTLLDRDIAEPWPPHRNEPCWCGSERKYKKCCGLVHAR
ncbi:MAG: SEC-C metal-binding domain-containing protein [Solirubrobacteraceae bacterium]